MMKCILFLLILLSMVTSSFAASSRRVVTEKYTEWMRCHNNTTDPSCPPCVDENGDPVRAITEMMERTCLPDRRESEYVFSTVLTFDQRRARDTRICNCFKRGEAGVLESLTYESFSFENSSNSNLTISSFESDGGAGNGVSSINFNTLNMGPSASVLQRVSSRVLNERYLNVFSATSFTREAADTVELGGRYSFTQAVDAVQGAGGPTGLFGSAWQTINQFAGAVSSADERPLDQAVINSSNLPVSSCIPYRNFLASRQFPQEPEFYSDLASSREFNPADWNYSTMVDTFRGQMGSQDYDDFLSRSEEARRLHRRMSFLHDNPVLKNIFQSQDTTQMTRAFNLVKTMPVPCNEPGCRETPAWISSMQRYRQQMANLLKDPDITAAARAGAARSRSMLLSLEALRTTEPIPSSDVLMGDTASSDAGQWKNFCESRDRQGAVGIFDTLEEDFGRRSAIDPQQDESYREMNEVMCKTSRKNPRTNRSMTFVDYFASVCPDQANPEKCSQENRAALVAAYMDIYSESPKGEDRAEVAAILPFIDGELSFEAVTEEHTRNLNSIAGSAERQRESFNLASEGGNFKSSLTSIAQRASTAQTQTAETKVNSVANPNGNINPNDPVFVPQSRTAEVTPETLQTAQAQLAEGENESREIRDEISSLRDVLRRSPASEGSGDTQAMTDLNQRLASLERRLQARERENSELRDQIEDAGRRSQPQRADAQTASGTTDGRRVAPVASQAVAQGGSSSGVQASGPVQSGGPSPSSASSVAGRTAGGTVSRAVISSGNAALLSKYNVQSGSVQGSIVVADPSSAIDYQSLRTQSEGSVIPLTLTTEEYNLIASNDQSALNRYLAQVRAMPGNVVRLNITSEGQQLELFVLKNGNEISVIPANSPGRRPAALPSSAREFTLSDLQNELRN